MRGKIKSIESSCRPGQEIDSPANRIHVHRYDPFSARGHRQTLELPGCNLVTQQVTAGIAPIAGGRYAHLLPPADRAVITEVRGKVELSVGFNEPDVALSLRNHLQPFLTTRLRQVAHMTYLLRCRIEGEHLCGYVVRLRTENVIDGSVARCTNRVVSIVAKCEAGVIRFGNQFLVLLRTRLRGATARRGSAERDS